MSSSTDAPASPTAQTSAPRVTGYSYVVAVALMVIYIFNFMDRQFLAALGPEVKHDLHLNDTELGALTGLMFALFYTFCGIPVAALADRYNRVRIIAIASGVWSLFTAACGLSGNFITLALLRMGVGVGEAGGSPPSYSVVSDYFPPQRRGEGLAIYSLGVPFGTMVGAALAGFISGYWNQHHGSGGWRVAFFVVGLAGLIVTPLLPLLVKEPKRGAFDPKPDPTIEAHEPAPSMFAAIVYFVRSPVLMLTGISAGLTSFVGYAMLALVPTFLQANAGMSKYDYAKYYSLLAGIGMGIGTWLAGWFVDKLGAKRPAIYAIAPGVCILASIPFVWGMVFSHSWQEATLYLIGPMILNITYLAPALAVVQNGVPPQARGTAGALLLFLLNLIGLGGGPLFLGYMSDTIGSFAKHAPTGAALLLQQVLPAAAQHGEQHLRYALLTLTPFFVLAFLCQMAAAVMLRRQGLMSLKGARPG